MKNLLLLLALLFSIGSTCMADIVVTTGGDPAVNGTNLQTALDAAVCGDRVILTAGATYDGTFILANKSCSVGNGITVTTNAVASLGDERVGPGDVANMARVRTLGGGSAGAVFEISANAGWWIIDGLEMTDNAADSIIISNLVDCASAAGIHDIVIQRSYMHNKETGTDYHRSIRFATQFEGSGLTLKWNYIDILGYYQTVLGFGSFAPIDTSSMVSVSGNTITLEDNYVSVWYSGIFMGGGDTLPQNTATITSSSTTSGTFSNVTGLAAGVVLRLDLSGAGTVVVSGSTLTVTRTSGVTLTSADVGRPMRVTEVGGSGTTGTIDITDVTGSVITGTAESGAASSIPNGNVTFVAYETAMVDSVAGSVVNYTPYSTDALTQAPAFASWNYGDQGLIYDVTLQGNTFYIDPEFSEHVIDNNGNHPKGFFEIKNSKRMTVDGNYFLGFTAAIAWTASNQNGTAPWITCSETIFSNNWFAPDQHAIGREAIIYSDNQYIHTNTPSGDVQISNNLVTHVKNLISIGEIPDAEISHNTVINDSSGSGGYNSAVTSTGLNTVFSFVDNIIDYRGNGIQCFVDPFTLGTCYPSGVFLNNVAVDTQAQGFGTSVWGAGSVLSPIPTSFNDVGFVNIGAENYELDVSSDFKGAASDATDPGVDWDALLVALAEAEPAPVTQIPPARKSHIHWYNKGKWRR